MKKSRVQTTRRLTTKTRYVLFNGRHHAVRLGEVEDLNKLQMEARSLHEISGDSYRIYDTKVEKNVYLWPQDNTA